MNLVSALIALTICLPWAGALLVWRLPEDRPRARNVVALGGASAAALAALALLPLAGSGAVSIWAESSLLGALTFTADGLGVFLAAVAGVIGSLTVLYSLAYMEPERGLRRYYALVLLFLGAMNGLVLAGNLVLLFIFWEITALCSYALISFHNDDPRAVAGGLKALIVTQVGGLGLLAGVLAAHAHLGSYQIADLLAQAAGLPPSVLAFLAFGFLAAALAKSAQLPFHTWLPDAMEAPTPVSALIHAATMVNAGVYLLARFYPAFAPVPGWATAVTALGVASALLAAFMALAAVDLKRVLAYSTISQLGYMVAAVGAGAIFASQFHLLSHAVFKALLFLGAGAVIHAEGTRDMRRMGGLGPALPFVRSVFIVGALALAGLPFLNGFCSKELLLEACHERGPAWAYVSLSVGAGLTALYTARFVWMVFFGARRGGLPHPESPALPMRIALGLLAAGALTSWLLAGPLSRLLARTLPFHDLPSGSTVELIGELLTAGSTYQTLGIVALGLAAWGLRGRLAEPAGRLVAASGLLRAARTDFGFEWLNRQVVRAAQRLADTARLSQTGQLAWNIAGLAGGLTLVLFILAAGGGR